MASESKCPRFDELRAGVDASLQHLIELTALLRQVFLAGDYKVFNRYDKELENAIGRKERSIGALRQHSMEHRCEPSETEFIKKFVD
jgi:hypothetical protein